MKKVTVEQLIFKERLSMIEQMSLKDFLFKWLGSPEEGLNDILPLEYTEDDFAKLEKKMKTELTIYGKEYFRYITLTEDNQIIIGVLDSNNFLQHRILSLDERLV
ncbi:hypothetical protein [Neobacillus terrae]|uniref:hypothetical protein n=1 Tax=Neobacillus terrae TaxID=3034837 RepID=UPI001408BF08|nr:hypothetical protein [Neobacillus terrae]NHM33256.1 hypothetical protein [Neobacillus terrae]